MRLIYLLPAFIAAGGLGVAIAAAILRSAAARRPMVGVELRPPEGARLELAAWATFFRNLYGIATPWWKRAIYGQRWVVLEFKASGGRLVARAWFAPELTELVTVHLQTALPGLDIAPVADVPRPPGRSHARSRICLWRDELFPLGAPKDDVLRGLLAALASCATATYQLSLAPDVDWQGRALRRLDQMAGLPAGGNLAASAAAELMEIILGWIPRASQPARPTKTSHRNPAPPTSKAMAAGWRAELRLETSAPTPGQAKQSMHAAVSALRALEGANGLRPARVWLGARFSRALAERRPPGNSSMVLVAEELAQLFHLPCTGAPLDSAPIRLLPDQLAAVTGKILCLAEDPGRTAVAIQQADCRQHIHVLGPTGAGKSTLLLNLALDDIAAGRGVGVIDPKGDLVRDLLERIPPSEADRLILIDPSARDLPVGLNVLETGDPDLHDVVTDGVVTIFKKAYERFWGPRTDDILRAALLTLLRHPGATLCEVPLLLLKPEARQAYTEQIDDPIGLGPFWDEYRAMAEGQRLQMVGPVLNKLRSVLLRRTVRNMLGQSRSTVDLPQAMDEGRIVLISLAKGLLGEETSRLLGSFLVARLWQAALARADRPESARRDFNLYLDEFQTYLHLPQTLDDVLVEARGYRLSLVLANQHLGQLSSSTRETLAANARTRVVFQCGQEDARYLAREFEPWLGQQELRNLQRFQVAVRLCRDGRTIRPLTGLTRPAPPPLAGGHLELMTEAALKRWGRPRQVVESEILGRLQAAGYRASDRAVA